jgi:CBS domain-containing protein
MAKNEGWCASADEWRKNFAAWIGAPDPQEMLALNLCFDFSAGHGEIALAENLRLSLMEILRDQPAFFIHLAREALRRRTSFPQGNALFQGVSGDTDVDLKELSAQFVMYGRLYSLKQGLAETNTYRRFEALAAQGVFGSQLSKHALEAYDAVTRLRMQRFSEGSTFPLRSFSPLETAALREAYSQSALIQKKIAFDFPGASG